MCLYLRLPVSVCECVNVCCIPAFLQTLSRCRTLALDTHTRYTRAMLCQLSFDAGVDNPAFSEAVLKRPTVNPTVAICSAFIEGPYFQRPKKFNRSRVRRCAIVRLCAGKHTYMSGSRYYVHTYIHTSTHPHIHAQF